MSPFTVHEEAMRKSAEVNIMRPQEAVPEQLPENFSGSPNRGLPVKQIPHMEFPRAVYKHPKKPLRTIEHKNDKFEVVGTETIPTEHLTKNICCDEHQNGGPAACEKCQAALEAALKKGWVKEPYIPAAQPNPDADLY